MTGGSGDSASGKVSRRGLFKQVGVAGAAALAGTPLAEGNSALSQELTPVHPAATVTPRLEARETLTAAEADILEAIVARLIPSDENGPGATEARAAYYIDRALAGPLRSSREAYADNLAALDAYALSVKGGAFARLSATDQDAILADVERNAATGFSPNAATFFNLVRTHTLQGTFCDPYYGGNANFVGWDLIGYPGIRMAVGEDEQRLKAPQPVHKSAYDHAMFTVNGGNTKGGDHGHRP
jgi:gluconate 2-dehydrogenase gamma chain